VRLDEAELAPFEIPDGSVPVGVSYLLKGPVGRDLTLLVAFPDGWQRTVPGHYEAAEEVVVLSGRIEIGDLVLDAGDWGFMPSGWLRTSMRTVGETVCVARFFGPARWVRSELAATDEDARSCTLGGPAMKLLDWDRSTSWFGEAPDEGPPAELLDPSARTWTWGEPAGSDGPFFIRTYPSP